MNIFLYFYDPLPVALDELEDALDEALSGAGQVSGAGTGIHGSNIDIAIDDEKVDRHEAVKLIRGALSPFVLPPSSTLVVDGERFGLV